MRLSFSQPLALEDERRRARAGAGGEDGRLVRSHLTALPPRRPRQILGAAALTAALLSPGAVAADTLTGTAGPDLLTGKAGTSTIRGLGGRDTVFGDPAAGLGPVTNLRRISAPASTESAGSPVFSPDGEKVAFHSVIPVPIQDIDPPAYHQPDTNGLADVFVRDLFTGAYRLVSTSETGAQGNGGSYAPSFAPDSRRIAFQSDATNLVPGDRNGVSDIFVKTIATGRIRLVSTNRVGVPGNGPSTEPVFSADGRIAFTSAASNLVPGDTNGVADVFLKDLASGTIRRISLTSTGQQANGGSSGVVLSRDGTLALFVSNASNLVAGDTNGRLDVFLKNLVTGAIRRVSTSGSGVQGNAQSWDPAISPGGDRVAFVSDATNLVPGDTNDVNDVFVKHLGTGAVTRVSVKADGGQAGLNSYDPEFSPDGTQIAFSSDDELVPGDTLWAYDVFVRDLATGTLRWISPDAATGDNPFSLEPRFSPDGTRVVFEAAYKVLEDRTYYAIVAVDLAPGPVGNDNVAGGPERDTLFGAGGRDRVQGEGGNDRLFGGPGEDVLRGGEGWDLLVGGPGRDALDGGAGYDRASFADASRPVRIVLSPGGRGIATGGSTDAVTGIEAVLGSRFGDHLASAVPYGRIEGGPGDDTLVGVPIGTGQTVEFRTAGHPMLVNLGAGESRNRAGYPQTEGTDVLEGIRHIAGSDLPHGDLLIGDGRPNVIAGLAGPDILKGNGGPDRFLYGSADDSPANAPDTILDLRRRDGDRIDLLALGPLTFVGALPFSGAKQIRAAVSGTTTTLAVNLGGSLAPEMRLVLIGVTRFDPDADLVRPRR